MRNLKKIFLILGLLFISMHLYSNSEFKIVNLPTGMVLDNSEFFSQLQFEDNGNIRLEIDAGAFKLLEFGVSLLFTNVIGSNAIGVDIPKPYIAVQLLSPKMDVPLYMKLGWDGKDILPLYSINSRRGLFLSLTKLFKGNKKEYGSFTLGFHSPFIDENYIGFYLAGNFYLTKAFTIYFIFDDSLGFFLDEAPFKSTNFFQGGPAIKINMNRNWGLGLQFLFDNNGDCYRYFFVHYTRWL